MDDHGRWALLSCGSVVLVIQQGCSPTFRRVTGSKFIMHDTKLMLGDAFCYVMMGE